MLANFLKAIILNCSLQYLYFIVSVNVQLFNDLIFFSWWDKPCQIIHRPCSKRFHGGAVVPALIYGCWSVEAL